MIDNKVFISRGGIMMLLPVGPCLALMAIGAIALGVGVYSILEDFDCE